MTPHEKAYELKEQFHSALTSKECALVAVNEVLEAIQYLEPNIVLVSLSEYWLETKEQIEKL